MWVCGKSEKQLLLSVIDEQIMVSKQHFPRGIEEVCIRIDQVRKYQGTQKKTHVYIPECSFFYSLSHAPIFSCLSLLTTGLIPIQLTPILYTPRERLVSPVLSERKYDQSSQLPENVYIVWPILAASAGISLFTFLIKRIPHAFTAWTIKNHPITWKSFPYWPKPPTSPRSRFHVS